MTCKDIVIKLNITQQRLNNFGGVLVSITDHSCLRLEIRQRLAVGAFQEVGSYNDTTLIANTYIHHRILVYSKILHRLHKLSFKFS